MHTLWTEEDKFFIANNAATMTDKILAEKLQKITGREVTMLAVRQTRKRMKIKKCPGQSVCKLANTDKK